MSALPTDVTRVPGRRRLRVTPLGLLGAVAVAVVLGLFASALLGSGSMAVPVVLVGAAAVLGLAVWTAPGPGSYRPRDGGGGYVGGSDGGWGGDGGGGGGGGDGGGGC